MVQETGYLSGDSQSPDRLSYSIRQFEGPLDLLLHLVQKAQVNIYDIPVAQITDQFLAYLDMARKLDLNDLTEFYAMAAHLLYLKSRMLLPSDESIEDDEEFFEMRSDLVQRLLEYQKFKRYSALLSDATQSTDLFIQRKKSQFMLPFEDQELWNDVNVWDLLKTFSSLLRMITPEQVFNVYEEVTTKQKLALMAELFESSDELSFMDIVVRRDSPMDIICAFLAILEAVKFSMISIHQHSLFGDIVIRRRNDFNVEVLDEQDFGDEEPFETLFKQDPIGSQAEGEPYEHELYDQDDEVIDLTEQEE